MKTLNYKNRIMFITFFLLIFILGYWINNKIIKQPHDSPFILEDNGEKTQISSEIKEKIALAYPGLEGIDCVGHKNKKDIACVLVDQIHFTGLTKILIFQTDITGNIIKLKEFSPNLMESVNFICGASCYPSDFGFEGEGVFKYKGHDMLSPDKFYTILY